MPLSQRDRRTLIIGGVIMVVMLGAFFAFNSTQNDEAAAPSLPPVGVPTGVVSPTGVPTVAPSNSSSQTPPPSTATPPPVFTGRDPFSIPAVLVTVAPVSPTSPTGTSTIPPSSTGSSPPPTTPPPTSPTQPGGGSSTIIDGHTVNLLSVFPSGGTHKAQVEVDGKIFNPSVGDKFDGGRFELRSVSGNCATFLYGDQSFGLCAISPK